MIHTEADLKASELTDAEKEHVKKHAQRSAELIAKYPGAPMASDVVIRQHHGVPHGIGFSETYSANLSPMSIVFILAHDFTDYIIRSGDELDISAKIKQMRSRYSTQRFQKIIDHIEKVSM